MELLGSGADFAETAAQLSEEPGAEGRQGLLVPGRDGLWVPEFWAAALALEPGDITRPDPPKTKLFLTTILW